ncbi:MAG TPA: TIGR02266 family protein, partial [Polyangiaceae bacterium]|nr:TIGR02266 family protein [Polyangiaceae bacterium]
MTVRYKSATLDEFIEHHSHDVSRGGMFIKTPSPFPPGTLLKFEVKIADEQKVIQGVGRVVWKRESETSERDRPNGMGVKFIKIDDASRKTIDQLVSTRADAGAAYEAGGGDTGNVKTAP